MSTARDRSAHVAFGGRRHDTLIWTCSAEHRNCAAYAGGPCNAKPTNSNPKTIARQRKRKR